MLIAAAFAIAEPVQWLAAGGGPARVRPTTRWTTSGLSGGILERRVLSHQSPAVPVFWKRSCQRHDELVAGCRLDRTEIEALANRAVLFIAHNAAFDRPFAERISPLFKAKPWACSMYGIPWKDEGIEGRRLTDLLARFGLFFDSHRAAEDCLAAIELLTMTLPKSGSLAMAALLEQARIASYRMSAEGAPFEAKDKLKARGYRWNGGSEGGPRAWWIEVPAGQVEAELTFLETEIFRKEVHIPIRKITAFERYSTLAEKL